MTKEIDAMIEAGWTCVDKITYRDLSDCETLMFTRPKQKPNAVVDFALIETILNEAYASNSRFVVQHLMSAIKKT